VTAVAYTNTAIYTYDAIGQVVGDVAAEGTTNRMNEQLHYGFDAAGNLNYRTNNALIQSYQVNSLNQLTTNTNGGRLTVMGTTTSVATNVAVNGTNAARYGDATFAATNMPLTTGYTAVASDSLGRRATNTVNTSIPANNTFQYDGNGNLTNDGLHSFAYDDENQLIQVWVPSQWFSQFTYDGKMRRRIRQEFTAQGSGWVQTNEVCYVYDGNVVIQERDINNLPTTTYTRGNDLSGSLQGAGGIGGLLSMTLNTGPGTSSSNSFFYHSDGNGNITMLINSSQGIAAKYLYDAFGNILSKSGLLADANLYRFSSKEAHLNSGLVYCLYRYYDPNLQRWPNPDPIGERGGINLYGFVGNSPINFYDPFGFARYSVSNPTLFGVPLPTDFSAYEYGDTFSSTFMADLGNVGAFIGNTVVGLSEALNSTADQVLGPGSGDALMMAAPELLALGDALKGGEEAKALDKVANDAKAVPKAKPPVTCINATKKGMGHVLERHIINGIPEFAAKSKFTTGTDLTELIQKATQSPMTQQANGNFARIFDAGQTIGVDRTTGNPTSIVTVITDSLNNLVTMFPGKP
jgi:RHS repeat-associated protein